MKEVPKDRLLPPVPLDITKPNTLAPAFEDASVVVSLVGLMHGRPQEFDEIQWHGAENVARAAKQVGAKLVHFSAIGADPNSRIPYARTKGLAEISVLDICPNATVIRPSLVFGPEDDFFNVSVDAASKFASLSRFGWPSDLPTSHDSYLFYLFMVVVQRVFSLFTLVT